MCVHASVDSNPKLRCNRCFYCTYIFKAISSLKSVEIPALMLQPASLHVHYTTRFGAFPHHERKPQKPRAAWNGKRQEKLVITNHKYALNSYASSDERSNALKRLALLSHGKQRSPCQIAEQIIATIPQQNLTPTTPLPFQFVHRVEKSDLV
ncbi:hypothetical protein Baya_9447 [Bagarius yarrelli]|uniref:Uncharacterized protein n=1 Tax=Bagarius yarrelli TaxID=175774 RepID=A0A556U6P4_BAGYA|nr:hypothetical protein Baya_9447 [Bagarius yarrelli]